MTALFLGGLLLFLGELPFFLGGLLFLGGLANESKFRWINKDFVFLPHG